MQIESETTKAAERRISLYVILSFLLSSGILVFLGTIAERSRPGQMVDFELVYFSSRMVLQHHDPYNVNDLLHSYQKEKIEFRSGLPTSQAFKDGSQYLVNLPTTLWLAVPLAKLSWAYAHVIWMILTTLSLVIGAFLAYALAADHSRPVAVFLTCFLLANCEVLLAGGNISGLAVGLCVISVWCFIRKRFLAAGVPCLALSLVLKPHDSAFILLFLLLIGPISRKHAVYVISLAALISVAAVLWVSRIAPHWSPEQSANLAAISSQGEISDPSPRVTSGRDPHTVVDLQTVISVIKDDPKIYNPVSYLIGGLLLLIWMVFTVRSTPSPARNKMALAAVAALSMLPIYHRLYDAKLLLLTVPACAMLWAEGGVTGRLALGVNTIGIFLTGDIPSLMFVALTRKMTPSTASLGGKLITIAFFRPFPLVLLSIGILYLSVFGLRSGMAGAFRSGTLNQKPQLCESENQSHLPAGGKISPRHYSASPIRV